MHKRTSILLAFTALTVASTVFAQPVVVRRLNSTGTELSLTRQAEGTNFSVDVSTWSNDDMLQVFHEGDPTDTTNNIGVITIDGLLVKLSVLIGGNSSVTIFPESDEQVDPACYDFAGLVFSNSTQARFSQGTIWVQNDITGPVTIGRISRVDALHNIDADITATTIEDNRPETSIIERISAGNRISGNITAVGSFNPLKTVDLIIVGPSLSAEGITGDIVFEWGKIGSIYTTGKIGTNATTKSTIHAGRGITEIRAISEQAQSTLLDRDFFADIVANGLATFIGNPDLADLRDRALFKLHTNGDFVGSIEADFIRNDPSMAVGDNLGTDWGVIVGGSFTGEVLVRHSVLDASIAAKTFTPPTTEQPNQGRIVINHGLEGSIIATAIDGHIPSISVGRTSQSNLYAGFIGSKAEPQTFPFVPFTPASSPRFAPMPAQSEPDSVIAAASIGHATILRMLRGPEKLTPPRIECPSIGELIIDDMRQGVVWSGRLEYHALDSEGRPESGTDGRPRLADPQDRTNDYSNIGTLTLGCVSPGADVWIEQTPSVKISEHLLGELFLPRSPLGQIIRIDRRLGTGNVNSETDDRCPCDTDQVPSDLCNDLVPGWPANTTPPATDSSPRNIGIASTGAIRIEDEIGLKGQIVINGSNLEATPAKAWSGAVVIGEAATTPIVLAPGSASPHTAPYYQTSSAMLGGGSVGLVPFRIHEVDCEPPHRVRENPTNPELVVNTNFISVEAFASTADAPCKVRFYGPVMIDGGVDPTVIECASEEEAEVCGRPWQPAAGLFTINGPSGGATGIASRTMSLSRRSTAPTVHVGKYRVGVRPVHATGVAPAGTAAEYWRVCMGGLDEEESEAFFFRVAEGNPVDCQTCPADFDCSTMITVQDIFDFLAAWFGNDPSADVNQSGTITIQDIFDFLGLWFGGC